MKKRLFAALPAALAAAVLLSGCGRSGGGDASSAVYDERGYFEADVDDSYGYEAYPEEAYWEAPAAAQAAPDPMPPADADVQASGERNPAKIIYTATLDMETLAFDEAYAALSDLTASCGGYYESSSVSERGANRHATVVVRVPAAQYRAFIDGAGALCHVLSRSEQAEDVSEAYYDTAGRLETQNTKLRRLQELLAQAKDMEDIITVESAISETEELIDRLSGTLRRYDALVDYSTVTVYLNEVRVYEEAPPETYGSRLGAAFTRGWRGFVSGLGDIVIALAYSWLWLVLIAAVAVVVVRLVKKHRAAHPKPEKEPAAPPTYATPGGNEDEDRDGA